jgi:hypothetical protein
VIEVEIFSLAVFYGDAGIGAIGNAEKTLSALAPVNYGGVCTPLACVEHFGCGGLEDLQPCCKVLPWGMFVYICCFKSHLYHLL